MKSLKLVVITFIPFIIGCSNPNKPLHYELVGGNPEIDYLDIINDSTCRFVLPGAITVTKKYIKKEDVYIIQINELVKASLHKVDDQTLKGDIPFFEGTWKLKE